MARNSILIIGDGVHIVAGAEFFCSPNPWSKCFDTPVFFLVFEFPDSGRGSSVAFTVVDSRLENLPGLWGDLILMDF